MLQHDIIHLESYPKDGNHMRCLIDLPFDITKGRDGFSYTDKKGNRLYYNNKKHTDTRWIILLASDDRGVNKSLSKIFEPRCSYNIDIILKYAHYIYRKSLKLEVQRLNSLKQ